jgi:hypothetical protein
LGDDVELVAGGIFLEDNVAGLAAPLLAQRRDELELGGRQLVEDVGLLEDGGERPRRGG